MISVASSLLWYFGIALFVACFLICDWYFELGRLIIDDIIAAFILSLIWPWLIVICLVVSKEAVEQYFRSKKDN